MPCRMTTVSLDAGTAPVSQKRGSFQRPVPPSQVTVAAPTTCGRRRAAHGMVVGRITAFGPAFVRPVAWLSPASPSGRSGLKACLSSHSPSANAAGLSAWRAGQPRFLLARWRRSVRKSLAVCARKMMRSGFVLVCLDTLGVACVDCVDRFYRRCTAQHRLRYHLIATCAALQLYRPRLLH